VMANFIGFDLGGTNLSAAIVDTDTGSLTGYLRAPSLAHEGEAAVIARMIKLINAVIAASDIHKNELKGIGIGVPGVLDLDHGVVLFLPNLPGTWPNVPLAEQITQATGLPTWLLNDARSMTLAEWIFGAGRGVDTMACFTIGTGIGGGLVINGKLHLGVDGTGGELGHQIVDIHGPVCGCGSQGCLETFASGSAIRAHGIKAVTQGLSTSIGRLVDYDLNRITPEVIHKAAREGDKIALDIYKRAGGYIGIAISNVMVTIGPRKVVIGGGVSRAGDLLLNPIRQTVAERVFMMPKERVEIVTAQLGTEAGLIGAAVWAREQYSTG
jgi:glucokinase